MENYEENSACGDTFSFLEDNDEDLKKNMLELRKTRLYLIQNSKV